MNLFGFILFGSNDAQRPRLAAVLEFITCPAVHISLIEKCYVEVKYKKWLLADSGIN
jgi:hypothetical protein